jgi:E3 ubiquitin-protein ligase BRE1
MSECQTFQKDAILRQMKEYKREKQDLEKSVKTLEERSKHYKDNLRMVDAWWKQVCHLSLSFFLLLPRESY